MTSHWTGGDGDWSDASTWTPAAVPATADAVLLDGTAAYTLTVSDAEAASSLALSDDSATLSVTGTLAVAGAASLASGVTLLSGTLSAGSLTGTIRASGGTLSGGTVTGTLALVSPAGPFAAFPAPGALSVGGLAMSTGAVLSVRDVELGLLADQSLAAGTLALGTAMDGGQAVALAGHILTVGRGATVLLPDGGSLDGGTLVNAGTINAQHISPFAGGTLSVGGSAFAQDGTLLATNQAVLVTAASFDNTGTLSVSNGALLLQAARASNEGVISLGFGASLLAEAALSGAGTLQVGANARAELQDLSGTVALAPGGDGSLRLDHAEAFTGTITGLGPGLGTGGGTLELAGLSSPVLSVSWSGGRMLVTEASGAFSLAMPDLSPAATFALAADAAGDGYDVTVSANCFGRGTAIRARRGSSPVDVPVEELEPGDAVWSPRLRSWRPVLWVGHRRLDCRRHPEPDQVRPVRLPAGCLGDGLPHRDLVLSPEHCLFVPPEAARHPLGALVPARLLPAPRDPAGEVEYFHVEVPGHDVLLAEGVPAETFLDDGARSGFGNGPAHLLRHPELARRPLPEPCAPMALSGPAVEWLRARMAVLA